MNFNIKNVVVALEECGYQCQYLEGTLTASKGSDTRYFVENSKEEAIGSYPDEVTKKLKSLTEAKVNARFSSQTLNEMGYGNFSPSADKPTGTEAPSTNRFKVKPGEKAVTDDNPEKPKGMKGIDSPVDDKELPKEFTGGSKNNEDPNVPNTEKGAKTTVGATGGGKNAGANKTKNTEKGQKMSVGNSLYQQDASDRNKGDNYTGTKVGELGSKKGDGGGSKVANAGDMPADLPKDQPAQSVAKIPSVKAGKMAVTGTTVESVLSSMFEATNGDAMMAQADEESKQKAQQLSGQNLILLTQSKEGGWNVGSSFEKGWSPSDYLNVKEAANSHITTGGSAAKVIVTGEPVEQIRELLSKNPSTDPATFGQEVMMTEVLGAIAKGIGSVAKGAANLAGGAVKGAAKGVGALAKGAGNVAGKVANTAAGAVGSAARGATDLAAKGVKAGVDAGKSVANAGVNLGKGAVNTATDAVKTVANSASQIPGEPTIGGNLVKDAANKIPSLDPSTLNKMDAQKKAAEKQQQMQMGYRGESVIGEAVKTFPMYNGILETLYEGPYISRTTFKQIDLAEMERKLTPHLVEAIAMHLSEQDVPPEAPLPGDEEEDPMMDDGMGDPDMGDADMSADADMGAPDMGADDTGVPGADAEGMPADAGADEAGLDDAGAGGPPELDGGAGGMGGMDIGAEPSPQPVGGEPEMSGTPAPEPELPSEDRWAQARESCPDCDDAVLSELVQYGIINDLQKAIFNKFIGHLTKTKQASEKQPLVASQDASYRKQPATKDLTETAVRNNPYMELKRLESEFLMDSKGVVGIYVETLMKNPDLTEKAARLVLGIEEKYNKNWKRREVEAAANQLQGIGDQVYEIRDQLRNLVNTTAGDILKRVSSPLAQGAFASEANQMISQLEGISGRFDQFLKQMPHWVDAFNNAYSSLGVQVTDDGEGGEGMDMGMDSDIPEEPMDDGMGMDAGLEPAPDNAGADLPVPPEGGAELPPPPPPMKPDPNANGQQI